MLLRTQGADQSGFYAKRFFRTIQDEIRALPVPLLPQALKILRSLKEGVLNVTRHQPVAGSAKTGFCGLWQDERTADEIVADIATHRSGFGGRKVQL